METIVTVVSVLLLAGLILSPILIMRIVKRLPIKFKFLTYLVGGLVVGAIIVFVFAWWSNISDLMLLKHYGYNINGMNESEFYGKVLPENMDRVKSLEKSIMGIGWPLKAIMAYGFYFSYILILYCVSYLIGKIKIPRTIITNNIK